jgi:uncharacterized membrane protein
MLGLVFDLGPRGGGLGRGILLAPQQGGPKMGHINITASIDCSIETVFAYVDDYKNTTKYMRDLAKWQPVGNKKHGKGAVFEVGMKAGPKVLESTIEMDKWVENKTIAWESTDGFWQKGSWAFKTVRGKTEATYDMEYEFGGGIAGKLLAKAAEPIVRMNLDKSIAELKVQCEKLAAKAPASASKK